MPPVKSKQKWQYVRADLVVRLYRLPRSALRIRCRRAGLGVPKACRVARSVMLWVMSRSWGPLDFLKAPVLETGLVGAMGVRG